MAAPSGNTFSSNTKSSMTVYYDVSRLCAVIEDLAQKQAASIPGYSNTELANYIANFIYTGANNYGNSTFTPAPSRTKSRGQTWQGNATIQGVVNCLYDCSSANS